MASDEVKQLEKDMEYLMHSLRNGTAKMEGCLQEMEMYCKDMRNALEGFRTCLLEEIGNNNTRKEEEL